MIRLLVVDNEWLVVESLLEMFAATDMELEAIGVYSAAEALRALERTKFDIVLLDIRMPGMNGLELQQEIVRKWPWCKVIFLTGYDDFEYVQQVLRNGGADYLLKSEGHHAVLKAVRKAADQLFAVVESEKLLDKAQRQMRQALPVLQNRHMLILLNGNPEPQINREAKFAEMNISLSGKEQVLLVLGRVDDWGARLGSADRELMLYAIQNIAEEYLSRSTTCFTATLDANKLLWCIQPLQAEQRTDPSVRWKAAVRFVQGMLETIQMAIKQHLKLCVSFAASVQSHSWTQAPEQLLSLKRQLGRGLGIGKELILFDRPADDPVAQEAAMQRPEAGSRVDSISAMAAYLENGQRQLFFTEWSRMIAHVPASGTNTKRDEYLQLEIYYALVALFLGYINRLGLSEEIGDSIDLGALLHYEAHRSWQEREDYLLRLAELLFEQKTADQRNSEALLIQRVKRYVEHNLAGDLSLTTIGETVGYNPYYLTQLYKRLTGEGLTEFIAETRLAKAKKLLAHTTMVVQDISKAVGFLREQSFYRFFKKEVQLTPQEYRERHLQIGE